MKLPASMAADVDGGALDMGSMSDICSSLEKTEWWGGVEEKLRSLQGRGNVPDASAEDKSLGKGVADLLAGLGKK